MSSDIARRVALGAQGFNDPAPKGTVDRRHLRRVMHKLGVIQLDSIPVVIRTQYMPLHSRLGPYDQNLLDTVAYKDDSWFEAWSHEASLLPVESEPLFRWMKDLARDGRVWKGIYEFAQAEPNYVAEVLAEVRERGAVTGGELSNPRPVAADSSGWGSRSLGVTALDWLFRIGEVGIRRRGNFEKVFSPLSSIVPDEIISLPTPDLAVAQRELTMRSVRALGVGTAKEVADYFRIPIKDARRCLEELIEEGAVIPAEVRGRGSRSSGSKAPLVADPEAKIPRKIEGATVLSPFDPVVWNRDRALRMFDFEYRIEIYVPESKRRWGYYVLPVMVDGEIVARLDLKADRTNRVLRVKRSHLESGRPPEAIAERVADALSDLAHLVDVDTIDVEAQGEFAKPLAAAVVSR